MTTTSSDRFGEVRSALHNKQYSKLERWVRRGLDAHVEDYLIQMLDRVQSPNTINIGTGVALTDAQSVFGALRRTVELWRNRSIIETVRAQDAKMASTLDDYVRCGHDCAQPMTVAFSLGDGQGGVFYRRVMARHEDISSLHQWTLALISTKEHQQSAQAHVLTLHDALARHFQALAPPDPNMRRGLYDPWASLVATRLDAQWTKRLFEGGA